MVHCLMWIVNCRSTIQFWSLSVCKAKGEKPATVYYVSDVNVNLGLGGGGGGDHFTQSPLEGLQKGGGKF